MLVLKVKCKQAFPLLLQNEIRYLQYLITAILTGAVHVILFKSMVDSKGVGHSQVTTLLLLPGKVPRKRTTVDASAYSFTTCCKLCLQEAKQTARKFFRLASH